MFNLNREPAHGGKKFGTKTKTSTIEFRVRSLKDEARLITCDGMPTH